MKNGERVKKYLSDILSLGFALGFFLGVVQAGSGDAEILETIVFFYRSFPIALAIGLVMVVVFNYFQGGEKWLNLFVMSSFLLYFGFLKTVGWNVIPWIALSFMLGSVLFLAFRKVQVENGEVIFLLHGMGYLSSLYLFLHLNSYLKGWDATIKNLGLMIKWMIL